MSKSTVLRLEGNARKYNLGGNGMISRHTMVISCYDLMVGSLEKFYPSDRVYGNGVEPEFHDVNPRVPLYKRGKLLPNVVTKAIWDTLESSPETMIQNNLGIIINAKKVTTKKKSDIMTIVEIEMSDKDKHGIFNGAHTYATIRDFYLTALSSEEDIKEIMINKLKLASVWLNIDEGYDNLNLIADKSEGLSTSRQVETFSLYNYRGYFDPIKEAIKNKTYFDKIKFYEGDELDDEVSIQIRDILRYLMAFDAKTYKPFKLWSSNSLSSKYYISKLSQSKIDDEKSVDIMKKDHAFFYSSISHLPEFLELVDKIKFATINKKGSKKLGGDTEVSVKGGRVVYPFAGYETLVGYNTPQCFIAPVYCAFKANIDFSSETFKWLVPLDKLFDEVIKDLIKKPAEYFSITGGERMAPHEILRYEPLYKSCYDHVEVSIKYLLKK
jgi:hypothetical protein